MIVLIFIIVGFEDVNVIVVVLYFVSGIGVLIGIMKVFEDVLGKKFDEIKKEIVFEELVVIGDLGDDIG